MNDVFVVSVIIPTFNRAYCVGETIQTALAQTYRNVEVVIVDDGSTDGTGEMIARRFGGEPRVRYHYRPNSGVVEARNAGLSLARGEFIAFLDSDDLWQPWKVELQLACMARCPEVGMVWTDMEAVDDRGNVVHATFLRKMYHAWRLASNETLFSEHVTLEDMAQHAGAKALCDLVGKGTIPGRFCFHAGEIYSQMIMGSLVHTSTVLLRRERLDAVKQFNPRFAPSGEDYDFHLRTCAAGPVGLIDVPTVKYRVGNPDQLSRPELRVQGAKHCLETVTLALQSGKRIDLPAMMIRGRLAGVHEWIADALMEAGDRSGARWQAMRSLAYIPWRQRPWRQLLATAVPGSLLQWHHRRQQRARAHVA